MSNTTNLYQKTLIIKDFRNISDLTFQFSEGHNLFIGPNGHGKTNCLEAIALACSLKPMQQLGNIELIRFNAAQAKITASFTGASNLDVAIDIYTYGKKATLNGHTLKTNRDLAKTCSLVSFIPADLNLISGPQSLRRRALDQAAVSLFAEHRACYSAYEKTLLHRNRLLKDGAHDRDMLKSFTDLLINEGAKLMRVRLETLLNLGKIYNNMVQSILGRKHSARIAYGVNEEEICDYGLLDLKALLMRAHEAVSLHEYKRRVTLFGPHLDDVNFIINGANAKSHASRGQARALVFAFKLAQMIAIHEIRGFAPMIILDDIMSELDAAIKANLVQTVLQLKTQVFFSTADEETFGNSIPIEKVYSLHEGRIINSC